MTRGEYRDVGQRGKSDSSREIIETSVLGLSIAAMVTGRRRVIRFPISR